MKYTVHQQTSEGLKYTQVHSSCTNAEVSTCVSLADLLPNNFIHIGNMVFDIRTIIRIEVKEND